MARIAPKDLASAVAAARPGDRLELDAGELVGQVVIDKPLVIEGRGAGTWLGNRTGPVLIIRCAGVELRDLQVEMTGDLQHAAILVEGDRELVRRNVTIRRGELRVVKPRLSFSAPPAIRLKEQTPPPTPPASVPVHAPTPPVRTSSSAIGAAMPRPAPRSSPGPLTIPTAVPAPVIGPRIRPFRERLLASVATGVEATIALVLWLASFGALVAAGVGLGEVFPELRRIAAWWPVTLALCGVLGEAMFVLMNVGMRTAQRILRLTPLGRGLDLHVSIQREMEAHAASGAELPPGVRFRFPLVLRVLVMECLLAVIALATWNPGNWKGQVGLAACFALPLAALVLFVRGSLIRDMRARRTNVLVLGVFSHLALWALALLVGYPLVNAMLRLLRFAG